MEEELVVTFGVEVVEGEVVVDMVDVVGGGRVLVVVKFNQFLMLGSFGVRMLI